MVRMVEGARGLLESTEVLTPSSAKLHHSPVLHRCTTSPDYPD